MGKFQANIAALRQAASDLGKQSAEVKSIVAECDSILPQLEATWDGAASEAFLASLRSVRNTIADTGGVIGQYKRTFESLADKLEEQDRREEQRIRYLQMVLSQVNPAHAGSQVGSKLGEYVDSRQQQTAPSRNGGNLGGRLGDIGQPAVGKSNKGKRK